MPERGLVNRIIPFSYVDGPGNRSAIFFQGCDFRCRYCHNPETQNLCIACGACVSVCPVQALSMKDGKVVLDSAVCVGCDACIQTCRNYSSPKVRRMTAEEILEEIGSSLPFIEGITVSGGECTRYHTFIAELFRKAHSLGKTCFVDTNGQTDFRQMPELAAEMNMAMLDVKAFDSDYHRMLTGCGNDAVLQNLSYLAEIGKLYEVRTVIVPGYLDNEDTVRQVSRILAQRPQIRYKLIQYRPWGVRPSMDVEPPTAAYMEKLATLARASGVEKVVCT